MPDSFLFLLSGDEVRGYNPVIDDLIQSPIDLIFLETGETNIFGPNFESVLDQLQSSDTDGDGTRHVFGYVNLAVTDHLRTYWQAEWTLDQNGLPFSDISSDINQDAFELSPSGLAQLWLANAVGSATGPADNGAPGEQVFGPIVDFSDGAVDVPLDQVAQVVARDGTWWNIVIDQITTLYHAGWRDFFLDDVSRYFINNPPDGYTIQQGALDMVNLVNAVAMHLDALDGENNDTTIAINGGGFIMWNSGLGLDAIEIEYFLEHVDYLVAENLFAESPELLVQMSRNIDGTDTTLLSIEADTFLPAGIAGVYFELASTLGFLTHVPADNDYASGPTAGTLPAETYDDAPPSPLNVIVASGFGAEIVGTESADLIFGTEGDDVIFAFGGDDIIYGLGGNDTIIAADGDDFVLGGLGNDELRAGAGNDTIVGEAGGDWLQGDAGSDVLIGGNRPGEISPWELYL